MLRRRFAVTIVLSLLAILLLSANAFADEGSIHQIRAGETLNSIAAQHGIKVAALASANGIANPDMIRVGQRLTVPPAGEAKTEEASPNPQPSELADTYMVRAGDSLARIAKRLGVSAYALAAANGLADPDRIAAGMKLKVPGRVSSPLKESVTDTRFIASISAQHCWLYKDGELIGDWVCSSGRKEAPSVPGTYKIQSKIRDAYGSRWDFWMPYWLGLYYSGSTENGIHGLPYNKKTGRRTWEGMVGTPITYGCIMLDDANAKKLFETAYIGMPVVILP